MVCRRLRPLRVSVKQQYSTGNRTVLRYVNLDLPGTVGPKCTIQKTEMEYSKGVVGVNRRRIRPAKVSPSTGLSVAVFVRKSLIRCTTHSRYVLLCLQTACRQSSIRLFQENIETDSSFPHTFCK